MPFASGLASEITTVNSSFIFFQFGNERSGYEEVTYLVGGGDAAEWGDGGWEGAGV